MPVRVIGMIGVAPPSGEATVHVIKGGISPSYLTTFAQVHEAAGFDLVLVGYTASSAEGFLVAQHAAQHTGRLGFLIAHRPGFVAPTLAARKIATFDHLTNGRIALHIIAGASDAEQHGDGDFAPKEERYRRAAEYLEVLKLAWTSERRFDFEGVFYHVKGARSDVQPLQKPHPPLFFGGSSEGAMAMGARHCDVFAMFGEPLTATAERIADFRTRAAAFGRTPTFNMSFRPIL
ncbi:MAG TPA: LLM class flavin-dependent oxidoreductase, partial [Reyranella sp.]|nr:LLM class flavin-dependent oxidoreductase [Reyranella sp.]